MDDATFKILYEAQTEMFLFHVSWPSLIDGKPDQPGVKVEVLRPALRTLLGEGLVQIFEVTDGDRVLTLAEALAVVDQDTHWIAPREGEEPMTVIYGLSTTAAGQDRLWPEWEARQAKNG